MKKISDVFKEISEQKETAEFMSTGFKFIDATLDGGFMPQELVILGAQTGYGKSYFAGQVMLNIAKQGFKTAYFSLEITNKMIASRLVGAQANIKPTRISFGLLTPAELKEKENAELDIAAFDELINLVDDVYDLDQIIKIIEENEIEFAVVDFIQNVMVKGASDEIAKLTKIALDLQKAAKKNNCCIFVLSQLSNMVAREGSKGKTTEYKGSGGIATAADLGFIMERGEYMEGSQFQPLTITLKKNRRGISGQEFAMFFKHPGGMIYEDPKQ